MSLGQLDFEGNDRVSTALDRLRDNCPQEGYFVAFSGGKDSTVILELVRMAGLPHEAHYHCTTADPPELVHFIREVYPDVVFDHPDKTMWRLIRERGLPTRFVRFCCRELKEGNGAGKVVVTGVRRLESAKRSKRQMVEINPKGKNFIVNPIIDWSDDEVWEFIRSRGLPYCSLYDEGFKRLGCVMCPMQGRKGMLRDAARWPKIADAYKRAAAVYWSVARSKDRMAGFDSPDDYWDWWMQEADTQEDECLFGSLT
jgi:phosphoadenosine phosphosulfate reductase